MESTTVRKHNGKSGVRHMQARDFLAFLPICFVSLWAPSKEIVERSGDISADRAPWSGRFPLGPGPKGPFGARGGPFGAGMKVANQRGRHCTPLGPIKKLGRYDQAL